MSNNEGADMSHTPKSIDVVFDGPPGPEAGRFVEVEDSDTHRSIRIGEWIEAHDGLWILRIQMNNHDRLTAEVARLTEALEPFAELNADLTNATCHRGICSADECVRCGKVIKARKALNPEEPK